MINLFNTPNQLVQYSKSTIQIFNKKMSRKKMMTCVEHITSKAKLNLKLQC